MKRKLIIILLCFIVLTACGETNMGPKVWESVKPEVTKNLKFPDSAKFGEYKDAIIYEEDGKYYVLAEVTSKNALGIEVTNGFETTVTVTDGKYSVGTIEFYDNFAFNTKTKLYEQKRDRKKKGEPFLTSAELDEKVKEQGLYVTKTNIVRKSEIKKYVSGDYLQAVIQNNSEDTILSCVVAFACWDQDGLPLKIMKPYGSQGSFIQQVNFENINLKKGNSFGEDSGFEISEDMKTEHVRAIVVSYEGLNGVAWENPYYLDFVEAYEGKTYQ